MIESKNGAFVEGAESKSAADMYRKSCEGSRNAMSPVGSPACPYCEKDVALPAALPFGLASCHNCGERVWYLTVHSQRSFFRYEAARFVAQLFHGLAEEQPLPDKWKLDVLDLVELISSFEEALEEAS